MNARFELISFDPADVPAPTKGQQYDFRRMSILGKRAWAVLDHDGRSIAPFSSGATAFKAERLLNSGALDPRMVFTLPPEYYSIFTKWSAYHGQH